MKMNKGNAQKPPTPGMEQFKGKPMNYAGMPKAVDNAQNRKPSTKND